jgi:DNA phosphorothioation-dependent restriction protein DptF
MGFVKAINVLSKSSPSSVTSFGNASPIDKEIKDYLYIETPIERDFKLLLDSLTDTKHVIFLAGSSGDGKSEILTRAQTAYCENFIFHLDATHSFQPNQNAIETLNSKFSDYKISNKSLVIGINIGMLGNYVEEGASEYSDIKDAIRNFLNGKKNFNKECLFINFEDYPKFILSKNDISSDFISVLMERITSKDENNPFYKSYLVEKYDQDSSIYINYRILQEPIVQNEIILLLVKARLKYDQFLTVRTILDFIYCLLNDSGNLFDNIFSKSANELSNTLRHFDPCAIRSKAIDQFLIKRSVGIKEPEFDQFKNHFKERFNIDNLSPPAWIRVFFIFREFEMGNNYHISFKNDFNCDLFKRYFDIWELNQNFLSSNEEKIKLRSFYHDNFIAALLKFANRFYAQLTKEHLIDLGDYNGYRLAGSAEFRADLKRIEDESQKRLTNFNIYLKIGDKELSSIPVSVNFLELIFKINHGYRPNKHDKNTIIILDEIIDEVVRIVRKNKQLFVINGQTQWTLKFAKDDQEIIVGGA